MTEPPSGWSLPGQPEEPGPDPEESGEERAARPGERAAGAPGEQPPSGWGAPAPPPGGQAPPPPAPGNHPHGTPGPQGNGQGAYGGPPPQYGGGQGGGPGAYGGPPQQYGGGQGGGQGAYGGPPPQYPYGTPGGQPQYGAPYGQPPYGQPPYGQPQYGQPPYGQSPYGQSPYGQQPYGQPGGGGWGGGPLPSAGPGIVPLRPLSIGEIYDGAIRAIRTNPRTMVGLAAVVIAVVTLLGTAPQAFALSTWINSPLADAETADSAELSDVAGAVGAGGVALIVSLLQYVVATTVVSGLLITAVAGATRGVTLQPGELWQRCRRRMPALVGLAIVVPVAVALTVVVAMLPGLILAFVPGTETIGVILLVVGAIVGFFTAIGLYLGWWAVAAPALLLEDLGVLAALRRSRRLVRRSFWRVVGISLLTGIIVAILRSIFTVPFSVLGGVVAASQGDDTGFTGTLLQLLVGDIGTVLAGAVLYPFSAGVLALLYLDLRIRREGLDVDLMRA